MAFKIMRYKSQLETLKTIKPSSLQQPSHSSSSNHTARLSVTQCCFVILLLLRQRPAVWTWVSYFCPELQKALSHLFLCERLVLRHLPHILSALDCCSPLIGACCNVGSEVQISVGLQLAFRCATPEESLMFPWNSCVLEYLPIAVVCGLAPKYSWVNPSRHK